MQEPGVCRINTQESILSVMWVKAELGTGTAQGTSECSEEFWSFIL